MTSWTTQTLFKRTFAFLREHPVLALPVLIADLLGFAGLHLQHALHEPLLNFFFSEKSVISTSSPSFLMTPDNAWKVALLVGPLLWVTFFLTACFYSAALRTVSYWVERINHSETLNLADTLRFVYEQKLRIVKFAAILMALLAITTLIATSSTAFIVPVLSLKQMWGFDVGAIIAAVWEIPIIFIMTGPVLRFLTEANVASLSSNIKSLVRLCGIVAVVLEVVILLLFLHAMPISFYQQHSVVGFLIREAVQSLIGALPAIIGENFAG